MLSLLGNEFCELLFVGWGCVGCNVVSEEVLMRSLGHKAALVWLHPSPFPLGHCHLPEWWSFMLIYVSCAALTFWFSLSSLELCFWLASLHSHSAPYASAIDLTSLNGYNAALSIAFFCITEIARALPHRFRASVWIIQYAVGYCFWSGGAIFVVETLCLAEMSSLGLLLCSTAPKPTR